MKSRRCWDSFVAAGVLIAGVLAARGEPPPVRGQYRVIDLGRLGGARSEARGINEAGNVAGLSQSDTGYQAVRWRWRETNYVIEPLGPGEGYDIANDGTVVGLGDGSGGGTVWPGHGAPMMLGLDKRLNAIAVASGVPVGWVNTTLTNPNPPFNVKFPKHAASFSGSAAADLAQRPEWDCVANGVDSSGSRIVGQNVTNVFLSGVPVQAWLFPNRNLSGLTPYTNSVALAVNTSTQVVGYAYDISTLFQRPMYWSEATGMRLLNVPPTSPYGRAMAINDRGQAVGVLGASAVLWVNLGQPDETNVFLNNLPPLGHGWNLQAAYDINNRGEIVGYGLNPTGYVHGFVLVPTNLLNKIVALRALEVNQAVQDWENSVPLVADKRTLVRAHLELTAPDAQPVLVRGARLLVRQGTATVELAPLNAPEGLLVTTNDAHAVRADLAQSLNFELPPSWRTGTNVTLQLLWPHGRLVNREPADASGDPGSNGIVRVTFIPVPPIPVKWLFTQWTDTNGVTHGPAMHRAGELTARLLAIFPVPRVTTEPSATYLWTNNPPLATNDWTPTLLDGLLDDVQALRDRQVGANNRVHYYGVVTDVDLGGLGWAPRDPTNSTSASAVGSLPDNAWVYGRNRHAHEIAHNLGRQHSVYRDHGTHMEGDWGETAPTNTPVFPFLMLQSSAPVTMAPTLGPISSGNDKLVCGWDSHAGIVVNPFRQFELLGYADRSTWRWISTYTWTNVMNVIIGRFGSPMPPAGPLRTNLLVSGLIGRDDSVEFSPFYQIITDNPPRVEPGEYYLLLLSNATVLWETNFAPAPMQPDCDYPATNANAPARFAIPVPILPEANGVAVVRGLTPLAEITGSPNAPTVAWVFPTGGEVFGGAPFTAQWSGGDADGGPLTYALEFSPDGGQSWQPLAIDWPDTRYPVDATRLPATTNGVLRVTVSDGFHSTSARTPGVFTITNHAPTLRISRPANDSDFAGEQQIIFHTEVEDVEDRALDGTNVLWHSSRDGLLGFGTELFRNANSLTEGTHLITATAHDTSGATHSAAVTIRVWEKAVPRLRITLLGGQAAVSWSALLGTNWVLQSTSNLLAPSWTTITNTPTVTEADRTVIVGIGFDARYFRLRKQ